MRVWTFQLARTALIMAAMTLSGSTSSAPALHDRSSIIGECPEARLGPEVRLRKLHLVRPDLIPYPIWYEIYC